jgi:hypothetical protein
MNISYIKKQILEKVTIKNPYYNDIFDNYYERINILRFYIDFIKFSDIIILL